MIVVAILGILFVTMSQFNATARINQEKVTNLANTISDTIRDARNQAMIGKMDDRNEIYSRIVSFTGTTWQQSFATYASGATAITLTRNFVWKNWFIEGSDENMKIEGLYVSSDSLGDNLDKIEKKAEQFTKTNYLRFDFSQDSAKMTAEKTSSISDIRTFKIALDYKWFKRYIYGDILSGAIQISGKESKWY